MIIFHTNVCMVSWALLSTLGPNIFCVTIICSNIYCFRTCSTRIDNIWLGCCMSRANSMYEISSNQPSLVACPGLMWCATGLRFYYIGDTDPASKLAIGNGHLWSWDGFMAAHIWAINFAKKTAIYSVSAGFYQVSTRWWQVVSMVSIVS